MENFAPTPPVFSVIISRHPEPGTVGRSIGTFSSGYDAANFATREKPYLVDGAALRVVRVQTLYLWGTVHPTITANQEIESFPFDSKHKATVSKAVYEWKQSARGVISSKPFHLLEVDSKACGMGYVFGSVEDLIIGQRSYVALKDILSGDALEYALEFSRVFSEPVTVSFHITADEIQEQYENFEECFLSSCMTKTPDKYISSVHPVRVYDINEAGPVELPAKYGRGGVTLAVLRNRNNRPVARTLLSTDTMKFDWSSTTHYGGKFYRAILKEKLQAMGYSAGDLEGVAIARVRDPRGFVIPYLDNSLCWEDRGSFVELCYGGNGGQSINGICGLEACANCDCELDGEESHLDPDENRICEECFSQNFFYCEGSGDICHLDDGFWVDGSIYCEDYLQVNGVYCPNCEEWHIP
jgi:hypothetical protein